MSAHDEALVTELAELAAASLGWDWRTEDIGDMRYPSGPETIRPEIEVILDRLLELGWRPSPKITINIEPAPPLARPLADQPARGDWFRR